MRQRRDAVTEAQHYIQQQPTVGVDETGFQQRNGDGQNATKTSGWLWVAVRPLSSHKSFVNFLPHPNPPLTKGRGQDIYKSFAIAIVQLGVNTQTIKQPRLYPYMST
ncbi:MAG: hypothetical protein EAZ60_29410 [Oscillatoriales cyanobacterium]|nr:MAG: hypothetical protein EAZ60_29410 [Oscillatoriales cyanobacterium]